jgi:hypothetical protein
LHGEFVISALARQNAEILVKSAPFDELPGHDALMSPHAQVAPRWSPLVPPR